MNSIEARGERHRSQIYQHLTQSADLTRRTAEVTLSPISEAVELIVAAYRSSGQVLVCGNGGSAADAHHMAAGVMDRFPSGFDRPGLPALALTTDTSFLTSYANDVGFDGVFERQVLALGRSDDV